MKPFPKAERFCSLALSLPQRINKSQTPLTSIPSSFQLLGFLAQRRLRKCGRPPLSGSIVGSRICQQGLAVCQGRWPPETSSIAHYFVLKTKCFANYKNIEHMIKIKKSNHKTVIRIFVLHLRNFPECSMGIHRAGQNRRLSSIISQKPALFRDEQAG